MHNPSPHPCVGFSQKKLAPRHKSVGSDIAVAIVLAQGGCWTKESVRIFHTLTRIQFYNVVK